jgi:acetoacetate decarboxylase
VAYASFRLQKLDNLPWLGGTGYNLLGLYLHNVQYKAANGTMTEGSFIPLMVEDLADPIISGREQLGFPKVFSEIDVEDQGDTFTAKLSWRGRTWCTLQLPGLREQPNATNENTVAESILVHKYVPGTGPEVDVPPDADYAVVIPSDGDVKTSTTKRRSSLSTSSSIAFDSLDWQRLPTLHHIVSRLADVPIFEIVEATVVDANGVPDLAGAKRVET